MNEPIRLRYANHIVGVFLMVVFLIGCVVSVRLFTRLAVKKDRFYIELPEETASQLRTGAEVIILGETVGEVESLQYVDDTELVRVELGIETKRSDQITTDSEVELDRKFGVGAPVVRIRRNRLPGSTEPAKQIPPGSTIHRFRGDDDRIDSMAISVETAGSSIDVTAKKINESFDKTIDPAFKTSETAFDSILATSEAIRPQAVDAFAQVQQSTQILEAKVTQLTERVDKLVDQEVRQTIAEIKRSALSATQAAEGVQQLASGIDQKSDRTAQDVAQTLAKLRETAEMIQRLTQETRSVVRIVRGEAEQLPGTTERINDTVSDTQDLVGDINDHWLLRRSQNDKKPTQQLSPSAVRSGGVR
ncbi:MlaD family protein [Stieleria varia]|uniref:Mce/MlaD domain-containing protein n=1 Tax=Stieleria varia TaxID=2528005 RepID=A0A5C6B010_9BACT|nr:MlaD family protein [Stieleria varia]TWU04901.1 hypothetical protein Pla52n_29460 [Stieleria varia]